MANRLPYPRLRFESRYNWWLRGANSGNATNALNCNNNGNPNNKTASNTGVRALP